MTHTPLLIGLTGFKRSGKNAVGEILADLLPGPVRMISFAQPLKDYTYDLNPMVAYDSRYDRPILLQEVVDREGWEKAKDVFPEVRRMLQRMGTDVFRENVSPTYWVDKAGEEMDRAKEMGEHVVITDVRFMNEAAIIQERGGVVFRINRPEVEPKEAEPLHVSEVELLRIHVDGVIDNSGNLADLRRAVKTTLFKRAYGG